MNNCELCDHKKNPDGGHCYMFKVEPIAPCMQHTIRWITGQHMRVNVAIATMKRGET